MVYAESSSLAIRLINKQILERKYVKQDYSDVQYALIPILAHMFQGTDLCLEGELSLIVTEKEDYYHVQLNRMRPFKEICKDKSNRWIIILVKLLFYNGTGNLKASHETVLIIDREERKIRYFEPNGPIAPWHQDIEEFLSIFVHRQFPNYEFILAEESCPIIGPQIIAYNNFCAANSLFFVWASLIDPNYKLDELITELLKENATEVAILIEKFIQFIYNYAEDNGIFDFFELYNNILGILIRERKDLGLFNLADKYLLMLDVKGMQQLYDILTV